ncbi:MAG TPA: DUF2007 domain-containing protein [Leucothrix mucor]|nr:DUF2007 domain-containing protein [Leucothrix mucor]
MNSLITIASYTNSLQANIVKGRLQAEDIPATLANEQYINADWLLSNALGGVQIQVPEGYAQQAREIIKTIENGQLEAGKEWEDVDQLLCPKCQSDDIKINNIIWKVSFLFTNILHTPLPFSQHAYSCKQCQHGWSMDDEKEYSIGVILFYIILLAACFSLLIEGLASLGRLLGA